MSVVGLNSVNPVSANKIANRIIAKKRKAATVQGINLLPHQWDAIRCTFPEFADVCGYGSGKTFGMSSIIFRDIISYPGIKVGLFAPTFDLMALNNIPSLLDLLDTYKIQYNYNKGRNIIFIANGSMVICRSLDNPERIVGFEVCRSYADELDIMSKEKGILAWQKIQARTRQVLLDQNGNTVPNRQGCFTTPEGFRAVYHLFVKEVQQNPSIARQRKLIRAKSTDNYHLPAHYINGLIASYPKRLQEAYINGEFVNLTSGSVYYTFDRNTHGKPFLYDINSPDFKSTRLLIGVDFNVGKMAAIVHIEVNNGLHAIKEFVNVQDTPELCEIIDTYFPDNPKSFYPDSSGSNTHSSNSSESDHVVLEEYGQVYCYSKNPRVKDRVATLNNLIESGRYHVDTEQCQTLTECLEQQVYSPYGLPDKTANLDHPNDATGYCAYYKYPIVNRKILLKAVGH